MKQKKHGVTILLILTLIAGILIIAYPSFSTYWNYLHQTRVLKNYKEAFIAIDREKLEEMLQAADEYNENLAKSAPKYKLTKQEREEYNALLNYTGDGVMGYVTIPKIGVELPICHGMDDAVLQSNAGHLEWTSLPTGGEGTHCVISGHRGLPSAKLFTNLDKLSVGDTFTVTVLSRTMTYEVDQIRIVEPNELSNTRIVHGEDYCTLLTCTPYGINTQRLLVRGHRITNLHKSPEVIADAVQVNTNYVALFLGSTVLAILFIIVFVRTGSHSRQNRS